MIDYDLTLDETTGILKVTLSGILDRPEDDLLEQTGALLMQHPSNPVLLDHRNLRLEIDLTELYEMGEALEEHPSTPHVARMAVLVNPDQDTRPYEFFVNVMNNRGVPMRAFQWDQEEQALEWLTSES
ncbi:MAG: STAS/SEC14 domain-containing protein [Xanthomonadales bacterium]|nr:STAS/SEC14 domain-containing protein [Xanthomonadales bacterium]